MVTLPSALHQPSRQWNSLQHSLSLIGHYRAAGAQQHWVCSQQTIICHSVCSAVCSLCGRLCSCFLSPHRYIQYKPAGTLIILHETVLQSQCFSVNVHQDVSNMKLCQVKLFCGPFACGILIHNVFAYVVGKILQHCGELQWKCCLQHPDGNIWVIQSLHVECLNHATAVWVNTLAKQTVWRRPQTHRLHSYMYVSNTQVYVTSDIAGENPVN